MSGTMAARKLNSKSDAWQIDAETGPHHSHANEFSLAYLTPKSWNQHSGFYLASRKHGSRETASSYYLSTEVSNTSVPRQDENSRAKCNNKNYLFVFGFLFSVLGLLALLFTTFLHVAFLAVAGSLFFCLGSIMVAMFVMDDDGADSAT